MEYSDIEGLKIRRNIHYDYDIYNKLFQAETIYYLIAFFLDRFPIEKAHSMLNYVKTIEFQ